MERFRAIRDTVDLFGAAASLCILYVSMSMPDSSLALCNMISPLINADWRKAYHWLEKNMTLQDSLQLAAQNERTAQLQAKYEADKKEKEISLLKSDQQLAFAIVQRQKVMRNAAIAVAILLIFIGVLVISRYRAVSKARRLIELEKMRNNIARDLHDDMGSALSNINKHHREDHLQDERVCGEYLRPHEY